MDSLRKELTMIKSDLGKLNAPFFEEELDNGMKVLFLPRKSPVQSALLYVPSGAYLHVDSIQGVKIPSATSYLVKETILSEKTKEDLLDKKVLSETIYDYSYTGYQLTSTEDIFPALQQLLTKIRTLDFTEEEIEAFKKNHISEEELSPMEKVKNRTLAQIFMASPLKNGLLPSSEEIKSIHRSTVKRYLSQYYPCNNLTLFLSMDAFPMDISDRVKDLKVPGKQMPEKKERIIKEPEDVLVSYSEMHAKAKEDYLCFAIKLRKRESLYETFGQLLFCFYEILLDAAFRENEEFLSGVKNAKARLVDTELRQGYEEAAIVLTFACSSSTKIIAFVNDYLADITKHVSKSAYKKAKESYYARSLALLSSPYTALKAFARANCDKVPYTGLSGYVLKASYSNFAKFLHNEVGQGKKSACYLIHRM